VPDQPGKVACIIIAPVRLSVSQDLITMASTLEELAARLDMDPVEFRRGEGKGNG